MVVVDNPQDIACDFLKLWGDLMLNFTLCPLALVCLYLAR